MLSLFFTFILNKINATSNRIQVDIVLGFWTPCVNYVVNTKSIHRTSLHCFECLSFIFIDYKCEPKNVHNRITIQSGQWCCICKTICNLPWTVVHCFLTCILTLATCFTYLYQTLFLNLFCGFPKKGQKMSLKMDRHEIIIFFISVKFACFIQFSYNFVFCETFRQSIF